MFSGQVKVTAVMTAVWDSGQRELLPSPIVHSLVYYLMRGKDGICFPGYVFSLSTYPKFGPFVKEEQDVPYPRSTQLSDDLETLVSAGLLEKKIGSICYRAAVEARHEGQRVREAFDKLNPSVPYDALIARVRPMANDWEGLIRSCRELYLR
jgi:hypothetical protein